MANQKKIEDLKFNYSVEVALKCLWAIRNEDEFYFKEYGKFWIKQILKQRLAKKQSLTTKITK